MLGPAAASLFAFLAGATAGIVGSRLAGSLRVGPPPGAATVDDAICLALEEVEAEARDRRIRIVAEVWGPVPPLQGPPPECAALVASALRRAMSWIDEDARLAVRVRRRGEHVGFLIEGLLDSRVHVELLLPAVPRR